MLNWKDCGHYCECTKVLNTNYQHVCVDMTSAILTDQGLKKRTDFSKTDNFSLKMLRRILCILQNFQTEVKRRQSPCNLQTEFDYCFKEMHYLTCKPVPVRKLHLG